jgi:uncharacterized protein (UPF0332 family)
MTPEQEKLLAKARENVRAAKLLLSQGFEDIAISRTYYAMFYVALAFLEGEGMSFKSYKGVLTAFGRDIAQTGKVPVEFGRMLRDAERLRNASDYNLDQTVSAEQAQEQISRAERFLELASRLIIQAAD